MRQCEVALAGIRLRDLAAEQPAFLKVVEHAAEISGVKIESARDIGGGRRIAVGDLKKYALFPERVGAAEISFPQQPDLRGVETIKTTDCADAALAGSQDSHNGSLGQLLD